MSLGISTQSVIKVLNLCHYISKLWTPAIFITWGYGCKDNLDLVCLSNLNHSNDILISTIFYIIVVVLCNIVSTAIDDNCLWMQVHNILVETNKHLMTCLTTNTTTYISIALKEIGMHRIPVISNAVSHEHHFSLALWQLLVSNICFFIALVVCPVFLGISVEG